MNNKSKDLRRLFRESLISSSKKMENHASSYDVHRIPEFAKDIRIYFYEFSDVTKSPRIFYQLESFNAYLRSCNIGIELYQQDIIKNLGYAYCSCYRGTHNLNLRASYKLLIDSMNDYDRKCLASSVSNIQKPPMIIEETHNRWPSNDGTFFG